MPRPWPGDNDGLGSLLTIKYPAVRALSKSLQLNRTQQIGEKKKKTAVDTDDLTEMAYKIIIVAHTITDFLKCDLGVRSKDYKNGAE